MKHPASRALFGYWNRLRAGRIAPERSELDPAAIRAQLGDVFLLEIGAPKRFLVRLAGTRVCALFGRELCEHSLLEVFLAEQYAETAALFGDVAASAVPSVLSLRGETGDGRTVDLEMLILPLRHRGRVHARLLGTLAPLSIPYWVGNVPLRHLRLASFRRLNDAEPRRVGLGVLAGLGGRLRLLPGGRA